MHLSNNRLIKSFQSCRGYPLHLEFNRIHIVLNSGKYPLSYIGQVIQVKISILKVIEINKMVVGNKFNLTKHQ